MNIKFPPHVIQCLNANGFVGEPDHWPFQAIALSNNRAYLLFSHQAGYIVTDNDWELTPMAKAALTASDTTALNGSSMDLTGIKGIARMVCLFPDGSLHWWEGESTVVVQASDGTTWKTLDKWCRELAKKESSIIVKLLGQRKMYTIIRESLTTWGAQFKR